MKKFSAYLPKNVIHFIGAEPTIVIGQVVSLYQQRLLFPYVTIKEKGFFSISATGTVYSCTAGLLYKRQPAAELTGHMRTQ